MFTGIVEEVGSVQCIKNGPKSSVITIVGNLIFSDLRIGDSVAVNGVCLTVTRFDKHTNTLTADIMHETLHRSSLGALKVCSHVNLERAMIANGRFGGHIMSGHIDGTGRISKRTNDDNAIWYTVKASEDIMKYIVEKGSIAIDGISLTVARVFENEFSVSIIPHTNHSTILYEKVVGDIVNLENDVVGKYIEKIISYKQTEKVDKKQTSNISKEFISKFGY